MERAEIRAIVAKNIRALARERGITLTRLADFAAVSKTQLFAVLSGTKAPTVDWIARVAAVLDVEPAELLMPRRSKAVQLAAEKSRARRKP